MLNAFRLRIDFELHHLPVVSPGRSVSDSKSYHLNFDFALSSDFPVRSSIENNRLGFIFLGPVDPERLDSLVLQDRCRKPPDPDMQHERPWMALRNAVRM